MEHENHNDMGHRWQDERLESLPPLSCDGSLRGARPPPSGATPQREDAENDSVPSLSNGEAPQDERPPTPEHAPRIEGYEILDLIGAGGMVTVWRAVQESTHREVALKLLGQAVFGSGKARERFEREVELTARLEHPNIARIYDSGLAQGEYYYAMELVAGLRLDEYVVEHQFSRRQILELMRTACEAVQHAHQRGVIHRDQELFERAYGYVRQYY